MGWRTGGPPVFFVWRRATRPRCLRKDGRWPPAPAGYLSLHQPNVLTVLELFELSSWLPVERFWSPKMRIRSPRRMPFNCVFGPVERHQRARCTRGGRPNRRTALYGPSLDILSHRYINIYYCKTITCRAGGKCSGGRRDPSAFPSASLEASAEQGRTPALLRSGEVLLTPEARSLKPAVKGVS